MFRLSEAAAASSVEARTLSGWLDRRVVDMPASGSGNNRRFTRDDVIRVALIGDLTKIGLSVADAARTAAAFCDDAGANRDSGELFPNGRTVLFVDQDGARCVNIDSTREQFEAAMDTVYSADRTVIVVVVNSVVARVDAALSGNGKPMPPAAQVFRHGRALHV